MIKKIFVVSLPLFFVLPGCATYKASKHGLTKVGYEETQLADGSYKLTYYGSSNDKHEDIINLWHKRAAELCNGPRYDAEPKNEQWNFNSYVVLPPFFFKSPATAPAIVGKLRCVE